MTAGGIFLGAFAMLGVVFAMLLLGFGAHTALERRKRKRAYAEALARFEARERGKIVKVGTIVRDCLGREHPWGFELDCRGRVPAMAIGPHGKTLMAGYTREELLEIAKRPSEFEP
jgi:hypothetical protein